MKKISIILLAIILMTGCSVQKTVTFVVTAPLALIDPSLAQIGDGMLNGMIDISRDHMEDMESKTTDLGGEPYECTDNWCRPSAGSSAIDT